MNAEIDYYLDALMIKSIALKKCGNDLATYEIENQR